MNRHGYLFVNSASRSGGRYLSALFDGCEPFATLPVELPSGEGTGEAWFLSDAEFAAIDGAEAWIRANRMDDTLKLFEAQPYQRMFSRDRRRGEPEIRFDYGAFRGNLDAAFRAGIANVGDAYLTTWRLLFDRVTIDGAPQPIDLERPTVFVNHFHSTVSHDYRYLSGGQDFVDFYVLQAVRDPYENIASLKQLWSRVSHHEMFHEIAFARWEIYLLSALRNRALYPDRCDLVVYDSDSTRMATALRASRLAPLRSLPATATPTVLKLPFSGHSFKERDGGQVDRPYDYAAIFTKGQRAFIDSRYRALLDELGADTLERLVTEMPDSTLLRELTAAPTGALEHYLRAAETAIRGFGNIHNLYYEFVADNIRARSPARRVADAWRIWRRMRP